MPQALKIPDARAAVEKKRKIGENTGMAADKSETIKKWSKKQNSELEPQFQKCKGRVVLRGDIVKDDSGSYAVFTEQGSSASKMTAAKVMDIISRLPGCAGQAVDAVSAYNQGKNGRCSQIIENSKIGMSRHLDSSTTTQMAKIMVQHGRPSRSSWAKSVSVILWQNYHGKDKLRKFYWNTVGRRFPIGNGCSYILNKDYSYLCMWMT